MPTIRPTVMRTAAKSSCVSAAALKAIVGLGNPGEKYRRTRHNAGFWFVERLLARHAGEGLRLQSRMHGEFGQLQLGGERLHLLMPATYMNLSGRAVRALLDFYKLQPAEMLVVHDELDLPPGTVRLKRGGGPGGHNGLKDTIACIGPDFARLRIGIGHPGDRSQVLNYVLSAAGKDEQVLLDGACERACEAVEDWLANGWNFAVNRLHTKES